MRVAVNGAGDLLGFATWSPASEEAELIDLFVEPDAMRRGIGSALVRDAAQRVAEAGLARLSVVAHRRTFAFYERAGFVDVGAATTQFGPARRLVRDL